jgi:adenylate cyclase
MGRSFYLRGLDYRSLRIARDFYAKASEIDTHYARCHSGMAICDYYLSMNDPQASVERMFDCAARSIELAPNLGEAHAARGLALYGCGDYLEAAEELDRAIGLDPRCFEANFFQGRCSRLRGLREEAVRLFGIAAELRPHDFRSLGLQAEEYHALGRMDEFNATVLRCLERVSTEVRVHPDNADGWAFGAAVLAKLGRTAQAEEWAMRASLISPDDSLVHYNVSRTYALIGKTELALSWMAKAMNALPDFRNRLVAWTHNAREFDPLRHSPGFKLLLEHPKAPALASHRPDRHPSRLSS